MRSPSDDARLPEAWRTVLAEELAKPYFKACEAFVAGERAAGAVFPPAEEVFTAFRLTPYEKVNVLLLGQDPYHDTGQAHGLSFSVKPGLTPPPSLANMYKELESDLGIPPARHGYLGPWAEQGMLMLNAVLTHGQGQDQATGNQDGFQFRGAAGGEHGGLGCKVALEFSAIAAPRWPAAPASPLLPMDAGWVR